MPVVDGADAQKAALREEFPGWSIIHTTDTGRWWAMRGPLRREDMDKTATVDADTPDGLRSGIRALDVPARDGL
ncbi:hypothetical protein AGRA3207_006092 [Actinomadura graeca]|uniref:Uncharacterized protein n=2 Tax=Actinomadura graeca TaxID=2750812 RepID=A0ABX8R718_9ACTN|nr:hypothetical protein [Actinomadura graeca]QXJ26855.1 hypothetical protein AGRA3207_006092 [Actinomadura graeca]